MLSPPQASNPRAKPLSVVVADDVGEIRKLLELWLSEVGCTVECVGTGNEVTRLIQAHPVDLVITDVIMPDGDGLEVIAEVKRTQPSVRFLAISGGGNHLQATDCLRLAKGLGAHGVLMKPFNREQLLDAVYRVAVAEPSAGE